MTRQNGYRTVAVITAVSLVFLQAVPAGVAAAAPVVADQASSASVSAPAKAATAAATQPTAPTQAAPATSTDFLSKTTTLGTAQAVAPASAQTVSSTSTTQTATAQATAAVVTPAAQSQTVASVSTATVSSTTTVQPAASVTASAAASVSALTTTGQTSVQLPSLTQPAQTAAQAAVVSAQAQLTTANAAVTAAENSRPYSATAMRAALAQQKAATAAVTAAQAQVTAASSMNLPVLMAPADAVMISNYPSTVRQYDSLNTLICETKLGAGGTLISSKYYGVVSATRIPVKVTVLVTTTAGESVYSELSYNAAGQITGTAYYSSGLVTKKTSYAYDANGQFYEMLESQYNAAGQTVQVIDRFYNAAGPVNTVYSQPNSSGVLAVVKTTYYQYDKVTYYPNSSWVSVPFVPDQSFNGVLLKHYDANGQLFREFVMTGDGKIVSMTLYGNATATQLPAKVAVISTIVGRLDNEIYYDASGQVIKTTYYSFVYGAIPFPLEAGYWGYASTSPNTRMEYDANGTLFAEIVMSGGTVYYQDPSRNMVSVTLYGNATFTQPPAKVVVKTSTGAVYSEIYCSPTGQVTKTTFYQMSASYVLNLPAPAGAIVYPSTLKYFDAKGVLIKEIVMDAGGHIVSLTLYGYTVLTQQPARVTVVNAKGKYSDIFYNTAGQVTDTTYYQGNGLPPV